jgi:carboxymethylenebutenolidase
LFSFAGQFKKTTGMRKLFTITLLAFITNVSASYAQKCCAKPGSMQALAMNTDFQKAHEAPEPFEYTSENGSMIQFPAGDKQASAFFIPAKHKTNRVLIVCHEWWGLNDYIKREAEQLQNELGDVDVYAVDLYDGEVATDAGTAGKLAQGLDAARGNAIVEGLVKHIGSSKKIATIGWCMGGGWSFNATLAAGKQAAACVMYYGFPEDDVKRINTLKTNVLYIYGTEDKYIKAADVAAFGKRVKATGHSYTQKDFKADHAFANPSNPHYNEQAMKEAKALAVAFLKKGLGL